ncbi:MAG: TetR family transcriptional regulator [Myxococcales bacterium]|nr:TetR family transcriptional regulator [Myxococcales bacterium]
MGRRARSPEAREARRDHIIAAAAAVFAERRYPAVSMAEVAARAGVAKGTPYLYFPTKEALFLELYLLRMGAWIDGLDATLAPLAGPGAVAKGLAASLAAHPDVVRLVALLHGTLEQNVEAADVVVFKQAAAAQLEPLVLLLEAKAGLPAGQGVACLTAIRGLVVGLAQMASPAPAVAAALEAMAGLRVDFEATLAGAVEALLVGWPR